MLEVVLAITIAGSLFAVLAGVLTNTMLTGLFARQSQNAIDLVSETIEGYRSLGYQAVAMDPKKIEATDPRLGGNKTVGYTYDPGTGGEPLVTLTSGAVDHHQAITKGLTPYTVWSYVTLPTDAEGGTYKRVTVRVTWTKNNALHERKTTTFISLVRRGLPLPNFTFGDPVEKTFGQGTTVVLPAQVVNRGARDAWNLGATAAGRSWAFTWYKDGDKDGVLDGLAVDPALTDTDTNGMVDTGLVETDATVALLAVFELPAAEPVTSAGSPVEVTLKAVSSAQPTAATGTKTVLDKVHVTSDCSGCTYTNYFLHNTASPPTAGTLAQADMPADTGSPTATTLYDYDTARDPATGRSIDPGGTEATADVTLMANWLSEISAPMKLGGTSPVTVKVRLYATTTSPTATAGQVTVYVSHRAYPATTFTLLGTSAPTTVATGAEFKPVDIDVPLASTVTLPELDMLEVKVVASGSAVWVAYDTTAYPAHVRLPVL